MAKWSKAFALCENDEVRWMELQDHLMTKFGGDEAHDIGDAADFGELLNNARDIEHHSYTADQMYDAVAKYLGVTFDEVKQYATEVNSNYGGFGPNKER